MSKLTKRSNELDLSEKIALITGAANGIGREIAVEMAKEGANIVIADIDEKGSHETQELLQKYKRDVLIVTTDVENEEQNSKLVDTTLNKFGRIDILVNNAGINTRGGIIEISREDALHVLNTNLIGPFFLTQRVAREMVHSKVRGSILFTSSIHSHVTQLHPAYTVSKAALEMFVRDIALELSEHGIRVNAVAPGGIAIRGEEDRALSIIPLGYRGIPRDIANAMVFLASEKASYITGQTLVVDGGLSLAHQYYWTAKGFL